MISMQAFEVAIKFIQSRLNLQDISDMDPVKLQSTFTPDFDREKGKVRNWAMSRVGWFWA